jgi:hypothetical protein
MGEVFLFEYATCGAFPELEPSITIEGLGMFKTLVEGFDSVSTFIDRRIPYFKYPRVDDYREKFSQLLERAEYCLLIAPETENTLYNLTVEAEKSGCHNLGSSSSAVLEATDKYLTYRKLREFMPRTEIFKGKTSLEFPLVAKPRDGVSCEGIFLLREDEDLQRVPKGYLVQEYVEGKHCSASLLIGDEVKILSVNTQEIKNFEYKGAEVPFPLEDTEDIVRAAEKIRGLLGYVGVDFVLNDRVNIIEINPRPTTPIIALNMAYGFNISKLIMQNYYRERIPEYPTKKRIHLRKERKALKDSYISFQGYSLVLEEIG